MSTPITVKNDRSALRAWAMYDWANSAYSTVIAGAVLPAYFAASVVPEEGYRLFGRIWAGDSLWGLVAGFGPLVMFLLVPILGAIADFSASKRRFLRFFALTGSIFTILLLFAAPVGCSPRWACSSSPRWASWPPTCSTTAFSPT